MIVQLLGGMEIVMGMSSLAGGLVLDKKQTGPGKQTPHQLPLHFNFLCLLPAMFITLGEVSTPSAGMIVVITLAAMSTVVSLTLRFALLWSARTLGAEGVLLRE